MVDKKVQLTAGMFILILAVGTTYFVAQDDSAYQCEATDTVGLCWKLSKVNSDGFQTRCYYNESTPTRYKSCKSGWVEWSGGDIIGEETDLPTQYNLSEGKYVVQNYEGVYEEWTRTKVVDTNLLENQINELFQQKEEFKDIEESFTQIETEACINNAYAVYDSEIIQFDITMETLRKTIDEYK